jgi:hypothetical protein
MQAEIVVHLPMGRSPAPAAPPPIRRRPLFTEVFGFLREHGFAPMAFEGVLDDAQTGEMLQVDGIFARGTVSGLDRH